MCLLYCVYYEQSAKFSMCLNCAHWLRWKRPKPCPISGIRTKIIIIILITVLKYYKLSIFFNANKNGTDGPLKCSNYYGF